MPNQSKIINAVNYCLHQLPHIDFELNTKGVCAGLSSLYVKYILEDKTPQFFQMLKRLSQLPNNYKLGTFQILDNFIIQIETAFRPGAYNSYKIQQGEIEKILNINNKPIKNEFSLGLITDETQWEKILDQISKPNRAYFISSHNHAIALSFKKGKYTLYDPNYKKHTKVFSSTKEVIQELIHCFEYKGDTFGLSIRAFAHPTETQAQYPEPQLIRQLAFHQKKDIKRGFKIKKKEYQSSQFAAEAQDTETLNFLLKENAIRWNMLAKEYLYPVFNKFLLKLSPSAELKNTLLQSISVNICIGNAALAELLIDHYKLLFTSKDDKKTLHSKLKEVFTSLLKNQMGMMKQEWDYEYLLKLCEHHGFDQEAETQTNYLHLKLLTLLNTMSHADQFKKLLNDLNPKQIINQIQLAARLNQNNILNLLLKHLEANNIDPNKYTSIYTKELIEHINALTLKKLLAKQFIVPDKKPELLSLCALRQDKTVFELYARAFAEQSNQNELWTHIDKNSNELLDLETKIGPVLLINTLIFLNKNELIKKIWRNDLNEDTIKDALTNAIFTGNSEMSQFLQKQLIQQKSTLDNDTLEFLHQKAIKDENITVLRILSDLNFNIFYTIKHIREILFLCDDYTDFSIVEASFQTAGQKAKELILETSLVHHMNPTIDNCIAKIPN